MASGRAGSPVFGNPSALTKHQPKSPPRARYNTPPPGAYEVLHSQTYKFKNSQQSSFGGNMSKVDREKTGIYSFGVKRKDEPGPDKYSIDAMGGKEKTSTAQRSPTFRFGSSNRGDQAKLYISRLDTGNIDANRDSAGRGGPGPGAYQAGVSLSKHTAPSHSFGIRLPPAELTPSTSKNVGPGAYPVPGCMGSQTMSTRPSSSSFSMGTASREKVGEVCSPGYQPKTKSKTPAPDRYDSPSGMGRQLRSTNRSAATFSFGTEGRGQVAKKKNVPGPGEYDWQSTMGVQATSRYRTQASFKFGTSERQGLDTGSVG